MKIVFMGTPHFAVPCLDILVANGYDIVGVITAPDKPAGRGYKLQQSAVKKYALSKGLTVLQPTNLKRKSFIKELRSLQADLQVVVAFRMLPAVVFEMPPKGTINVHASLLPQYRGAAPINWAVINGEKETGVTTFFIEQKIDTGKIIHQAKIPIGDNETAGELHDRLMETGATTLLKSVNAIAANDYPQIPQQEAEVMHKAYKIYKESCLINFDQSTQKVHDFIRGMSPYPTAYTAMPNGKTLKIFKAEKLLQEHDKPAGSMHTDQKTYLHFATKDGFMNVLELQLQGRRKMIVGDFIRGYQFDK